MSGEKCIALADYTALSADEISFHAGDVLSVTGKGGFGGFWQGYVLQCPHHSPSTPPPTAEGEKKKKGYFPNCFVTSNLQGPHSPFINAFVNKAVCLYDYLPTTNTNTNNKKKEEEQDTMYFHKNDILTVLAPSAYPGWWYGVNETERWQQQQPQQQQQEAKILLFPTNFVSCQIVLAVYEFEASSSASASGSATGEDDANKQKEVGCLPGDVLLLHRQWNDGWWEGTRCGFYPIPEARMAALPPATRQRIEARMQGMDDDHHQSTSGRKINPRGIFPSNYTVPNICTTRPLFFCQKCKQIRAEAQQCVSQGRPTSAIPMSPLSMMNENINNTNSQHHPAMYLSEVGNSSGGASCAHCAQQEQLVNQMLYNVAYARNTNTNNKKATVDLFAGINLLPTDSNSNNNNNNTHTLSLLTLKDVADARNVKFDGKV